MYGSSEKGGYYQPFKTNNFSSRYQVPSYPEPSIYAYIEEGRGKDGYIKNDPNYFDINSFATDARAPYKNPRNKKSYYMKNYPITGSDFTIWDILIF